MRHVPLVTKVLLSFELFLFGHIGYPSIFIAPEKLCNEKRPKYFSKYIVWFHFLKDRLIIISFLMHVSLYEKIQNSFLFFFKYWGTIYGCL